MTDQPSRADRIRAAIASARAESADSAEQPQEPAGLTLSDCYRAGLEAARAALAARAPRDAPPPRTRENASDGFKRVRAVFLANRRRHD